MHAGCTLTAQLPPLHSEFLSSLIRGGRGELGPRTGTEQLWVSLALGAPNTVTTPHFPLKLPQGASPNTVSKTCPRERIPYTFVLVLLPYLTK